MAGNIRQLENIIERLVVESSDGVITIDDLNNVMEDGMARDMSTLNIDEITKKLWKQPLEYQKTIKLWLLKH